MSHILHKTVSSQISWTTLVYQNGKNYHKLMSNTTSLNDPAKHAMT